MQLLGPRPPSWIGVSAVLPMPPTSRSPIGTSRLMSPVRDVCLQALPWLLSGDPRHQDGFHPSLMRMTSCIQTACAKVWLMLNICLLLIPQGCFIYKLNFLTGVFVYRKNIIYIGQSMVSGIHWESWHLFPTDKGTTVYPEVGFLDAVAVLS